MQSEFYRAQFVSWTRAGGFYRGADARVPRGAGAGRAAGRRRWRGRRLESATRAAVLGAEDVRARRRSRWSGSRLDRCRAAGEVRGVRVRRRAPGSRCTCRRPGRIEVEEPAEVPPSLKGAVVRFLFEDRLSLLLKEYGTERKAGWWVVAEGDDGPARRPGPRGAVGRVRRVSCARATDSRRLHTLDARPAHRRRESGGATPTTSSTAPTSLPTCLSGYQAGRGRA